MAITRLLTDHQIALVADLVRGGETLRDAAKWCFETFGQKIAFQTLQTYEEVKRAVKDRSSANKIDSNEKLEKAKPGIVDGLVKCMKANEGRQKDITEAMTEFPIKTKSREYLALAYELRNLETEYVRYSKEFNRLYEMSTLKESEVNDSIAASTNEKLRHLKTQMQAAPIQVIPKIQEPLEDSN